MNELIYPDLSYRIMGILFRVHNELGSGYQEKHYQKAKKKHFDENGIKHEEQVKVDIKDNKQFIGNYFMDFVIENKIILEIKSKPKFSRKDVLQVLSYLKETGMVLGILAAFSKCELKFKRLLRGY